MTTWGREAARVVRRFQSFRAKRVDTWNPPLVEDADELSLFRVLTLLDDAHARLETRVTPASTFQGSALGMRRIAAVVSDVIGSAEHELVVLGYELSDTSTLKALAARATLGVRVLLLLDELQSPIAKVRDAWPEGLGTAQVWHTGSGPRGKPMRLHAKAIVADGRRAVVGSANFTKSGMQLNIELALLIEGPAAATVRAFAASLISKGAVKESGHVGAMAVG